MAAIGQKRALVARFSVKHPKVQECEECRATLPQLRLFRFTCARCGARYRAIGTIWSKNAQPGRLSLTLVAVRQNFWWALFALAMFTPWPAFAVLLAFGVCLATEIYLSLKSQRWVRMA